MLGHTSFRYESHTLLSYRSRPSRRHTNSNSVQTVELVCSCNTPANPDKMLVGCTTDACKKWMHEQCILEDALRTTYKRLGTDKPHVPAVTPKKEENGDEAKRPLSPTETGAEQHSIDVKAETAPADAVHVSTKDNVEVRQVDDEDAPAAPEDSIAEQSAEPQSATSENANTSTSNKASTASKPMPGRKPGRPRKKGAEANGENARPWEGLFEVTLKMVDIGPPMIEFRDLREGVGGGEKTWTEPVKCLLCGSKVN